MRPRPYLSHSQWKLWKKSPDEYVAKYLFDKEQFVTKEMRFGSKMALALEDDDLTGDPLLDVVMMEIPKFECMDLISEAILKMGQKVEPVPLFGRMDTRKADHSAFKEYKTGKDGKGGWTQKKVDEDTQITFYAVMCYILTGKIPQDIELVWIITENDPENAREIICTGEIRRFPTKRSMAQVINMMAEMKKVWLEIGERCERELL